MIPLPKLQEIKDTMLSYLSVSVGKPIKKVGVLATLCQSVAAQALLMSLTAETLFKNLFIQFANDYWLSIHGAKHRLPRKKGNYALGTVQIQITAMKREKIVIPAGTKIINEIEKTEYRFIEELSITKTGTPFDYYNAFVKVIADKVGVNYNTSTLPTFKINGTYFDNENYNIMASSYFTGGSDAETTEQYRQRLLFAKQNGESIGNEADYILWATAIQGVERCWVYPRIFGAGTVGVVVLGYNNTPLSKQYVDDVVAPELKAKAPLPADISVYTITNSKGIVGSTTKFDIVILTSFRSSTFFDACKSMIDIIFKSTKAGGVINFNDLLVRCKSLAFDHGALPDVTMSYNSIRIDNELLDVSDYPNVNLYRFWYPELVSFGLVS
jgi:uncharacterized phage protein gp47/JayE